MSDNPKPLSGKEILIIDRNQDHDWQNEHVENLKEAGAKVVICENVSKFAEQYCEEENGSGLYVLKKEWPFDGVLFHLNGRGNNLINPIKALKGIPVVLVSALIEDKVKQEVIDLMNCLEPNVSVIDVIEYANEKDNMIEFLAKGIDKNAAQKQGGGVPVSLNAEVSEGQTLSL